MVLLVFAHPYPRRSRANAALLEAVAAHSEVKVHSLYDRYPDFDIDVELEQRTLSEARGLVIQHPIYWYSVPGLLEHWMDKVLVRGFAYGPGGTALHGKPCLWAPTSGGDELAYSEAGMHGFPFPSFVPPIEQMARFCGMTWQEPLVVHAAHRMSDEALRERASEYRARVEALLSSVQGEAS